MEFFQFRFENVNADQVASLLIDLGAQPIDIGQDDSLIASVSGDLDEGIIRDEIWKLNDGAFCEFEPKEYDDIEDYL